MYSPHTLRGEYTLLAFACLILIRKCTQGKLLEMYLVQQKCNGNLVLCDCKKPELNRGELN